MSHARRHLARVIDELAQPDDAVIRHAIEEGRKLRAGEEEALEPRLLRAAAHKAG